jgi:ribonuclease Z
MPKIIILGTSNAIPSPDHANTHMVLVTANRLMLIDCVTNPGVRLQQAGLNLLDLTDLVLTHFHPDHVSGVPSLLMDSWLMGRKKKLDIFGLEFTLDRIITMMDLFDWSEWPDFFPIKFHPIPEAEMNFILKDEEFIMHSSPVRHIIPNIGLRFEFPQEEKIIVYSSDTEPCEEVIKLASEADLLIHEAAGASRGHSPANQAGWVAQKAGAKELYLIHYPTWNFDPEPLITAAQAEFEGPVTLAEDFMEIEI